MRSFSISLFLLFIPTTLIALDPQKSIHQYVHNVWQIEQGLPQNSVQAIVQTRDGYLWLGTQEGLVRFDGVRFVVFNQVNTAQIKNPYINTLLEDHLGNLWIGTREGLIRFKDDRFVAFTTKDGLSNDHISSLFEDRQGVLWIGTFGGGLNFLKNNRFGSLTTRDGLSNDTVLVVYGDREGSVWIGTRGGGLSRLKDSRFTNYTTRNGLSADVVYTVCEDDSGALWIGTSNGLNQFRNGSFVIYTTHHGLSDNTVYMIREDREGNLWIGTFGGGLNRFRDGKFEKYTTQDGLSDDLIWYIYEDREENLWIGTSGGGLNRLTDGKFTAFTMKDGLTAGNIRALIEDHTGNIWIGTTNGLNRWNNGLVDQYTTANGLPNNFIWTVYEDRESNLWVGTDEGLSRLSNGNFTQFTAKAGLSNNFVRALYEDRAGNLWIGTRGGGISQFKNGKFTNFTTKNGLSSNIAWAFYEDPAGNLWIGTDGGGLNRFKNGNISSYTTKDGLSNDVVVSLHGDEDGNLWIGTWGGGLNRFKNGNFTTFKTVDGLSDDVVWVILEDGKGYLWMSCNKGIFKVKKQELNDFADGKINRIHSYIYGMADGMKSRECNGASQPAGWKTRSGRLWFPTIAGAVAIDADHITINKQPPPVLIEELIANNAHVADGKTTSLELPPGKDKLEFHYTALSFVAPIKVLFKYKLEGFDKDWVDANSRRVAYYTNIPPGTYTFHAKACNHDGIWNEAGASFSFRLKPHFYQTLWFYGLLILSAVFLAYQIHRYRLKRLLELERIRMRIATDLHDDIGAGLTRISILSELMQSNKKENGSQSPDLNRIAETSRELIDSMSDIVWAVDPEKDRLIDLLLRMRKFARDMLDGKNINHRFETSSINEQLELDPFKKRNMHLIYKEAVNNLVRHSGCSEVEIKLFCQDGALIMIIKDNGKGYDSSNLKDSDGHGLKSMIQRAEQMNAQLKISSLSEGTTIYLRVTL